MTADNWHSAQSKVKQPAKRILVISDNHELSMFLLAALERQLTEKHPIVDLRYTSSNQTPQSMTRLGAKRINIKDESTVDEVILNYDLVFSLHCKQIFPARLVENLCCVNFHPGMNPYNRGWYPQIFSIVNGLPTGATIHLMDADVDHGAIIDQQQVEIYASDTSLEVYRKIITAEKALIEKNLRSIVEGTFTSTAPLGEGNYNKASDFAALCKLDLNSVGTLQQHLNLLRATSHGELKNAYFIDARGRKCFVRVVIQEDE